MTQSPPYLSNASDIMDLSPVVVFVDEHVSVARSLADESPGRPIAVTDREGQFVGLIVDLEGHDGPIADCVDRSALTVPPDAPAFDVVSRMLSAQIDFAAVVENGGLKGVVTRRGVMAAYGETYS